MPVLMDKTDLAATLESARRSDCAWRRHKMSARDMIGFGKRFHAPRSTTDWMEELREGEE